MAEILTINNFCPYVKNASDSLRTTYVCKKTGQICPRVDYSSGKALPSKLFIKNGCPLIEEKQIIEEVKEVKTEIKAEVKEVKKEIKKEVKTTVNKPVKAEKTIVEEIVESPATKNKTEVEIKEKPIQNKPKTNKTGSKKRTTNKNTKKNKNRKDLRKSF